MWVGPGQKSKRLNFGKDPDNKLGKNKILSFEQIFLNFYVCLLPYQRKEFMTFFWKHLDQIRDIWPADIWPVDVWPVTFWGVGQLADDIFICYFNVVLNEITFVYIASEV